MVLVCASLLANGAKHLSKVPLPSACPVGCSACSGCLPVSITRLPVCFLMEFAPAPCSVPLPLPVHWNIVCPEGCQLRGRGFPPSQRPLVYQGSQGPVISLCTTSVIHGEEEPCYHGDDKCPPTGSTLTSNQAGQDGGPVAPGCVHKGIQSGRHLLCPGSGGGRCEIEAAVWSGVLGALFLAVSSRGLSCVLSHWVRVPGFHP